MHWPRATRPVTGDEFVGLREKRLESQTIPENTHVPNFRKIGPSEADLSGVYTIIYITM